MYNPLQDDSEAQNAGTAHSYFFFFFYVLFICLFISLCHLQGRLTFNSGFLTSDKPDNVGKVVAGDSA